MPLKKRIALIKQIEKQRDSTVICYLTSLRPNLVAQMSDDAVRVFFDHLLLLPRRPVKKLDIFLCSNGGSGTVPWRLISLFREYADRVCVLIPFRAYSAATLLALGADEIVMHTFAEMGPIDPTVTNEFNPIDPQTHRYLGISVEDVKAYISFMKSTVGIHHEDELVKTVEILANKVHPLALGNVERFISQSRMIARKLLMTHMDDDETSKHKVDEIIETMASKLYFHGHPINRREALEELKLKVLPPDKIPKSLEKAMWQLYTDFEEELQNQKPFDPMADIFRAVPTAPAPQVPAPEAPAPQAAPQQPVALPAQFIPPGISANMDLTLAIIESARLSSRFHQQKRLVVVGVGQMGEPLLRDETLDQGWSSTPAP